MQCKKNFDCLRYYLSTGFMYSFNKYLLNPYNMQGILTGAMREKLLKMYV